jgi:segregation and condensation protein A
MVVRELELDLDAFEGPFDLLLTLVLKQELEPAEVDVAAIVLRFLEQLAERDELDLEACGEFLVLVAALLELKARGLFEVEDEALDDLDAEEAAEELAQRLAEYRRIRAAGAWLAERLDEEGGRYFRLGPAPLAPHPARRLAPQDPALLADVLRLLAADPPAVSLSHMALRFPPVSEFLGRFRALLARRTRFDFDTEVQGLSRAEAAVAFLALLELRKAGEIAIEQATAFAPIRIARAHTAAQEDDEWIARSA